MCKIIFYQNIPIMAHRVLNEDWSDYDNKKKKKEDRLFFSCEESWEVDYLVRKLRKYYPGKTEAQITSAIRSCCTVIRAPRPRAQFVACVIERLDS
ncbi:hypothetical protein CK934_13915 [Chitinophaga sp. MD30]|nr:hypothetical protein CK934_13915 [Chitinophaga sp. MD30]